MKKIVFSITLLLGLFQISYGMEGQNKSSKFTPKKVKKHLEKYKGFTEMDLNNKGFTKIDLSNKKLTKITEKTCDYIKLTKELDLSNNKLTTLPKAITGLAFLEKLDLTNNPIETLPPLKKMKKLVTIDMDPGTYKKVKKSLNKTQKQNYKKPRIRKNSIASLQLSGFMKKK